MEIAGNKTKPLCPTGSKWFLTIRQPVCLSIQRLHGVLKLNLFITRRVWKSRIYFVRHRPSANCRLSLSESCQSREFGLCQSPVCQGRSVVVMIDKAGNGHDFTGTAERRFWQHGSAVDTGSALVPGRSIDSALIDKLPQFDKLQRVGCCQGRAKRSGL